MWCELNQITACHPSRLRRLELNQITACHSSQLRNSTLNPPIAHLSYCASLLRALLPAVVDLVRLLPGLRSQGRLQALRFLSLSLLAGQIYVAVEPMPLTHLFEQALQEQPAH